MEALGLSSWRVAPLPEAEKGQSWRRSHSRAQRGRRPGLQQLAWHVPDVASLKGTCLSCLKLLGYQRGVRGLGHPVSWDVQGLMPPGGVCALMHVLAVLAQGIAGPAPEEDGGNSGFNTQLSCI